MRSQSSSLSPSKLFFRLALLALALPVAGFSTAISASGIIGPTVCEVGGTCPPPVDTIANSLGVGQTSFADFNFVYTFTNGDQYSVVGFYNNGYGLTATSGSSIDFNPTVTYIGNNGNTSAPSAGNDALSLTMFQTVYDPEASPWDGNACDYFAPVVGPNETATANLSFGGLTTGLMSITGPYSGTVTQTSCAYLAFSATQNASDFLDITDVLGFDFTANTPVGTVIYSSVPEPAQTIPAALTLLGLVAFYKKSRKSRS